jgi:adenylosuccinate lyase
LNNSAAHLGHYMLFRDWYSTVEISAIFNEESLIKIWLEVEVALAEVQAELNIIPGWAASAIRDAVSEADIPMELLAKEAAETGHVLLPLLRELERRAGAAGRYIHWGATTQDILDTAVILQLKQTYRIVFRDLTAIITRLTDLAEAHRDTLIMGRTHGVHALPTTLGFKFSVWIGELLRHLERFDQSTTRVLVGQLGGGVGTMAGFGPHAASLRRRLMERLGLNTPLIAWQAARDNQVEFVLLASLLGGSLGKIANEIARLQSTEIGELAEPTSAHTVGSTTMPHKQNPLKSEIVVAASSLLQGLASPALGSLHTRNERDITTWGAELYLIPEAACLVAAQLQGMRQILNGLSVNPERMRQNAELLAGMPYSENLMLQLAESLGRDKAHEIVSFVALRACREGRNFRELAVAEPAIAQLMDEQQVREALMSNAYLGEAWAEVDRMVKHSRSVLQVRQAHEEQNELAN